MSMLGALRCCARGAARAWHCQPRRSERLPAVCRGSTAPVRQRSQGCVLDIAVDRRRRLTITAAAAPEAPELAPAAEADGAAQPEVPEAAKLDIRIGRIVQIETHPDADSLYVERVDVGEEEPRTIVSGLVKYVPIEAMQPHGRGKATAQGRSVVVLCNLKPRNMRGVKSNGMLLCASDAAHETVEPLAAPEDTPVGERVRFGESPQPEPATANQVQKKKIWEAVQPGLRTSAERVAGWRGAPMLTSAGPVTAATLADGSIS